MPVINALFEPVLQFVFRYTATCLVCDCEGDHAPIVTYDKNNVKIVFHIGRDRPRPDVVVVAVSVISSNMSSVKSFTFQAAVPKVRLTTCTT